MRAKQIAQRKARNQELARMDHANRCANVNCQRDLHDTGEIWEGFLTPGKFCSEACLDEAGQRAGGAQERA